MKFVRNEILSLRITKDGYIKRGDIARGKPSKRSIVKPFIGVNNLIKNSKNNQIITNERENSIIQAIIPKCKSPSK